MCTYNTHVFVIHTKKVYVSLTCAICMYCHVSWCQNSDQQLRKRLYVGADIYWEDDGLSLTVKQRTAERFQILYSGPLGVIGRHKLLQDACSRMLPWLRSGALSAVCWGEGYPWLAFSSRAWRGRWTPWIPIETIYLIPWNSPVVIH